MSPLVELLVALIAFIGLLENGIHILDSSGPISIVGLRTWHARDNVF
jgi:hypothetical protein